MPPLSTRITLPVLLCLLFSFLSRAQSPASLKVKSQVVKPITSVKASINTDSLYELMQSPPFEHPILWLIDHHQTENLALFPNPEENALIAACAIDKNSRIAYFFTNYGKVSDFVTLDDDVYISIVETKATNIFNLYSQLIRQHIQQINEAGDDLRTLGLAAMKKQKINPWLNLPVVKGAKTTLEKLMVLDECRLRQIQKWVDVHHEVIQWMADSVKTALHSPDYQPGICRKAGDSSSIEYFNSHYFSPVQRAVICPSQAMIFLYDQQHGDQAIDSFAIKKEKVKELLERKTNPFVLYRGWLEWQLQRTTDYLKAVDQQMKGTKEGVSKVTSSTLLQAKHQAALWGLHWVRNLSRLVLPDEGLMAVQERQANRRIWKGQDWFARISTHTSGNKRYELADHRGNVMAVVSDRKTGVDATGDGRVDYYEPEVISAGDYTPFGASMTGRNTNAGSYRYGYNGKENDKETGTQDYGMRIYDPRLGRFLSVDPLTKDFTYYTPYQFAGNSPIQAIDLDGLEEKNNNKASDLNPGGVLLSLQNTKTILGSLQKKYNIFTLKIDLKSAINTKTQKIIEHKTLNSESIAWLISIGSKGKIEPGQNPILNVSETISTNISTLEDRGKFGRYIKTETTTTTTTVDISKSTFQEKISEIKKQIIKKVGYTKILSERSDGTALLSLNSFDNMEEEAIITTEMAPLATTYDGNLKKLSTDLASKVDLFAKENIQISKRAIKGIYEAPKQLEERAYDGFPQN